MNISAKLFLAGAAALCCGQALAGNSQGAPALALAALVGERATSVRYVDKILLRAFLDGRAGAPHMKGRSVAVRAKSVDCRASNVDITTHECALTFDAATVTLKGRKAHELYATLIENGVAPEGAAGSLHVAVTALDCVVDADEVSERAGGGARCAFAP